MKNAPARMFHRLIRDTTKLALQVADLIFKEQNPRR